MSQDAGPTRPRISTGKLVAIVLLVLLVPVGLVLFVFPLLQGQPFDSVEELNPADIQSLQVRLLNRKELDGGPDVGPYTAAEQDYATLLAPLKGAREVADYPNARGPLLGEYRIRLKNGRRGTVRLYWVASGGDPREAAAFGAAAGGAALGAGLTANHVPPVPLRFQIGDRKYEGGPAELVVRAAEACAPRRR